MSRTVANPRNRISRIEGSGGGSSGIDSGKLAREMQRLHGKNKPVTDVNLYAYQTPKEAWAALQSGEVKPEKSIELAYNLRLVSDQLSVTAMQAHDIIKSAATSELGSFEIDMSPAEQRQMPVVRNANVDNSKRPLSRHERKMARDLGMNREEFLAHVRGNPAMILQPMAQTAPSALTGNGFSPARQTGSDDQEMLGADRNSSTLHTNRSSDTLQTDNDNAPAIDGHGAPMRHAESAMKRVERLQREIAQAQQDARLHTVRGKLFEKIASLDEGEVSEVEAVIDDLLSHRSASVYQPVETDRIVEAIETVSSDDIAEALDQYGLGHPKA
jgi:hypothetical protein